MTDSFDDHELDRVASGSADAKDIQRVMRGFLSSARAAGGRAVVGGRWLAEAFIELAPRIKVRDLRTLEEHHDGKTGADLAAELVRNAARASAAVGAVSGAVISAEQLAPPTWIVVPIELVAETLAIAAIELKLLAELHEVYGRPVRGTAGERTVALVTAWADRRGVSPATLARRGGLGEVLGRGTRNELVRQVRKRLLGRLGRNLSTLAPLLAGAALSAELNRRATRGLGEAIARDLALADPGPVDVGPGDDARVE